MRTTLNINATGWPLQAIPTAARVRRPSHRFGASIIGVNWVAPLLAFGLLLSTSAPGTAKPLDAENCARLKFQRDALEASGVRSAIAEQPPAQPSKKPDEKAQNIAALIQIEGQLRFRCNMELPIATLNPEMLREIPDTIDGEIAPKAQRPIQPVPKRVRPVSKTPPPANTAAAGAPAPARPKTAAAAKGGTNADQPPSSLQTAAPQAVAPVVKPRPKPRPKGDDSYHAPTTPTPDTAVPQPPQ